MTQAKPNPADYMFQEKKGETLVKVPGEVHGFQFKIRNLEDCVVHLLDHSAAVSLSLFEILYFKYGYHLLKSSFQVTWEGFLKISEQWIY